MNGRWCAEALIKSARAAATTHELLRGIRTPVLAMLGSYVHSHLVHALRSMRAIDPLLDLAATATAPALVGSKRGSELFCRAGGGAGTHLVAAQLALSSRATVTGRTNHFPVGGYATGTPHSNYDVSPDGRTFAFVGFNQAARVMIIQNLPALVEALRARDTRSR